MDISSHCGLKECGICFNTENCKTTHFCLLNVQLSEILSLYPSSFKCNIKVLDVDQVSSLGKSSNLGSFADSTLKHNTNDHRKRRSKLWIPKHSRFFKPPTTTEQSRRGLRESLFPPKPATHLLKAQSLANWWALIPAMCCSQWLSSVPEVK